MLKKFSILAAVMLLLVGTNLYAQVSCTPIFPSATDNNVVITYDAALGNRALVDATGDVYIHTGVITNQSTSPTDWRHVPMAWASTDTRWKMTPIGNNKYTFNIGNITNFYTVPGGVTVQKMAFVFRNATGSVVGRAADGSDMYYDVYAPGSTLETRILAPTENDCPIKQGGTTFSFNGVSSVDAALSLTVNGTQVASANNARTLTHNVAVSTTPGTYTAEFVATVGASTVRKSFVYVVPNATATAALPANTELGANWISNTEVVLRLDAPNKQNVYVIGSFTNWQVNSNYQMTKTPDGRSWWLRITGLQAGQNHLYQYFVDCGTRISDPLSTLVLDPWNDRFIPAATYPNLPAYPTNQTSGIVSVLKSDGYPYTWQVPNFQRPQKNDLVIYELHPRDFIAARNYQTLIDTINYLKNLGVTAIELMPVTEFSGNESWGYNPTHHMAIDKAYGTPQKLKEFIDVCHRNGMAVILDVVFNHTAGPHEALYWNAANSRPAADNPWLNQTATHDFNVFSDYNHESQYTREYVRRCTKYLLQEFKFDGFRWDLSKGFTQRNTVGNVGAWGAYDQSRIDILTDYYNTMQQAAPGSYGILEHFAAGDEETELANRGFMLWGNATFNAQEAVMGYTNNSLSYLAPKGRGWADAKHDKHIGYIESHDEERLMFKAVSFGNSTQGAAYNVKDTTTALRRMELIGAFAHLIPGPKMFWQFGELGYDHSIDFNGRTGNKPIKWEYFRDERRNRLYRVWGNLLQLRKQYPAIFSRSLNYNPADIAQGYHKHFHISETAMNVTIIGNFDVTAQNVVPYFQNTGTWYDYLTGGTLNVTNTQTPINLLPGEYRVYTSVRQPEPPLGYVRFRVGNEEIERYLNDFRVYPTPAVSGAVRVGYTLREAGAVKWEVFDLQGRRVAQSALVSQVEGSHEDIIDAPLASGTYIVRLHVNGASTTSKFVIQ